MRTFLWFMTLGVLNAFRPEYVDHPSPTGIALFMGAFVLAVVFDVCEVADRRRG